MRNDLPISPKKKFKYSITFESWDEESLEAGQSDVRGYEVEDDTDLIGDILYKANTTYGIYMPVSFGTWESTEPNEDRDFWEKGIRKYYALHITNEDGTEISQEESDFISFLLSDGHYEINKFRDYAVGGIVLGSIALGVGALITYFYFKGKKGKKSLENNRAKSVTHIINGKERTFPIKDAWRKDHNTENKSQKFEVPQADRYEMGGDASQHYHEIEYGEGGVARAKEVIMKKIGFNEETADYFVSKSEKFAIWLADSILKEELREKGYTKEKYLNSNVSSWGNINWQYSDSIRLILDWLQHPVTPKQDLKKLSFAQAKEFAKEWHNDLQVLGGDIDFIEPEKNTILKKYPVNADGIEYYWVFIPSNYCDLESSRMGHCGRTGYGNNLISLRSVKPYGKGHTINDSHITIAYGMNDGIFYQIKGKKNNKPAEKYFPYIFDLVKSAIKDNDIEYSKTSNKFDENNKLMRSKSLLEFNGFGSEYGDEEDYGFDDMKKEELRELYQLKPTIFNDADSILAVYDAGVITNEELQTQYDVNSPNSIFSSFGNQMKLYERGIILNPPSTIVQLDISCDKISRYLDLGRDINDDLVEDVLCGVIDDYYDNWSYYYDNWSDLLGNLNNENEEKIIEEIVRITGLSKTEVKENGINYYLNGDDENFSQEEFTQIFRVLANAQNNADTSDYHNYLYSNIKSALEELGEVESLNDEGAKITIDLSNLLSEEDISGQMDYYEFTDIADLFEEEISMGHIDLPKLIIDDRYTPYGSSKDFNDYISDSDIESFAKGGSLRPKSTKKKTKIKNMKPSQRKLAQGGTIETTGISKEDYLLVVQNWVYFTFNYPMGFVKDAFGSKHLEEKFSSSYERYGSIGVLMSFWANLDGNNRRILALWIKNNYFNSSSDKTKLQSISDDDYANIITHWNMFCFNFPYGFIENVYGENTSHFEMKWVRAYERAGSTGAVNKFFTEMSSNNQELLTDWVYDNYKGITFKDGGDTGKGSVDKKGKIELSDGAEGRKIAKRIIVETDDAGDVVTYDLEVGLFAGRKKGYFIVEGTWDEVMEEGTEDEYTEEQYFYQEGGLWIEGGKVYDYDGVYELEPKLKPLMSALNLNSSEIFADGGEAGGWKVGDKFRVLKGIYGDYNSPRYANQEFEVINIRDGKYIDARNIRGNTETFDAKNIEKISFADGGRVTTNDGIIESFLTSNKQLKVGNISTHFNEYDNQMLLRNYGTLIATRKGNDVSITNIKYSKTTTIITNKVNTMALNKKMNVSYVNKFAKGGNAGDWSVTDTTNAEYLGVIEFQDNEGEFHNFEIMETDDRLVFGGMTNSGFIESGYIEKDGFSTDETLQSLLEDLEVYYNDGAEYTSQIVFNQRMAKGGGVGNKTLTRKYLQNKGRNVFTFGYGMPKDAIDKYGTIGGTEYFELPNGDVYKKSKEDSDKFVLIGNKSKFADGGSTDLEYSDILNVLKSKIDDSIEEIPMKYENSNDFKGEEVEHESRDGFIPFTDGGYEAVWFEQIGNMYGTGNNLPNKVLDDEMNRQINYNLEMAKESFIEKYPELVEEIGVENIDYHSLNEAGYSDEAEELSEMESDYMYDEGTIMMQVTAYYYSPENVRGIDDKHTIRLFGDVNLESPYHRQGNLDDSYDIDFTFDSIAELEEKMDAGLKEIISWFDGDMYNDSTSEMKVRRMAKGGEAGVPEWSVTITDEDGETYDWIGFAKDEDEALFLAEKEAGFESVETGMNMITDENGNIIQYAKGGSVKGIKKKAEKLLEDSITYVWRDTDMGSGWKFSLENPKGGVIENDLLLDSFDGDDLGLDEDWDSLSKKDKKYYYEDWKETMLEGRFEYFKNEMIEQHLDTFIAYIQEAQEYQDEMNEYAGGGSTDDDLIEYTIPTWALGYLINDDVEGLTDEEIESVNKLIDKVYKEFGNASFMLGNDDESVFSYSNDIDSSGTEVIKLFILPSKNSDDKYAEGGRITKYVAVYVVQGNYGQGFEDLTAHDNRKDAIAEMRVYDDNESYPHRVIERRVLRSDYEKGNYAEGGEVDILSLYQKDIFSDKDSELIDEAIENGDIDTTDIKEDFMGYVYDRIDKEYKDEFETEDIWEYTDEQYENLLTHKENYKKLISFLKNDDDYAEGGEVEDWMEEALASLIEETGYDDLEITYVVDSKIKYEFIATNGDVEYRVFITEEDAENIAVEQVTEDLQANPDYFNQDWLMNYIDGRDFFEEQLTEMNDSYVQDIESETYKTKYANRLIDELVENGLMDEDDAESDNAEELADDLKYDYVALLTQEKLEEGNDGLDYFINNFGEQETYKMVMDNNLIDIEEASKDAVATDGIGHFLSSYDGETLYLSDDCVAYRVN
jgi:hypothetical protein